MQYWEDILVGQRTRGGSHCIEAAEVVAYRQRFAPPAWRSDGDGRAPDGDEAVPGMLLCCMAMRLLVDHRLVDMASLGSPGVDEVRWPMPAAVGDRLHLDTEILSTRALASRTDMGLVRQRLTLGNDRGSTVLVMMANAFVARRPVAG